MSRYGRPIGMILVLALLGVVGAWSLQLMRNPASYVGNDCERIAAAFRINSDTLNATLPGGARHEELMKYDGDLRLQLKNYNCTVDINGYLIATPKGTTSPTATPTTTPTTTPTGNPDEWTPHYYTLDKGKRADRDFGPGVKGGAKAVSGTKAEKAKAFKQISGEFKERMFRDPALLCANGGLILNGKDGGKKCVDKLVKSKSARDAYYAKVIKAIKSNKIEKRQPQYVESAVMVVPKDGVPRIVKIDTYRSQAYYVFVVKTKAGKTYNFRLECGFQWDTGRKVIPQKYTPVSHTPYTPVMPCVSGKRDEDGRCRPPSGGWYNPPPGRHTPPPSGGCDEPCGPPPTCQGKTCQRGPEAPSDRSRPTGAPTRNAETKAPARPDKPATTATTDVKAPDASDSPSDSSSAPADDDGSQENTGGGDPDN